MICMCVRTESNGNLLGTFDGLIKLIHIYSPKLVSKKNGKDMFVLWFINYTILQRNFS